MSGSSQGGNQRGGARQLLGNFLVSHKLAGGFGLLLLIMLAVSAFTLVSIYSALGRVHDLAEKYLPATALAAQIDNLTNNVALEMRGYTQSDNKEFLERGQASLVELKGAVAEAQELSRKFPQLTILSEAVSEMGATLVEYERQIAATVVTRDARVEAAAVLAPETANVYARCEELLASITAGDAQNAPPRLRLVNEISAGLGQLTAKTWTGLNTRNAQLIQESRQGFPDILAATDRLRPLLSQQAQRDELAALRGSLVKLSDAVATLATSSQQLDGIDVKRGEARDKLLAEAGQLSQQTLENIMRMSNETLGLLVATQRIVIAAALAGLLISLGGGLLLTRDIVSGISSVNVVANAIAAGDLDNAIAVDSRDELGSLARSIEGMQTSLRHARTETAARDWLKTGISRLNDMLLGELTEQEIADRVVGEVAEYLHAAVGACYVLASSAEKPTLVLLGSYAYTRRKNLSNEFEVGQGLVGQAALERRQILVSNVPEDYIKVVSGLGEAAPRNICVTPLLFNEELKGVLEIATLGPLTELQLEYVAQAMPTVAVALETAQARQRIRLALEESQRLSAELQAQQVELQAANEELQTQQEELQSANEELEEQSRQLQESEARLKTQQEELEVTNEELEERNRLLDRQRREVEAARLEITEKADELALASKYKSEFLANMSHELRTPLNSLLLLAKRLSDNREGNLTAEQTESAQVIHDSGKDLLSLINEILDLSKIEAGRMEVNIEAVRVSDLVRSIRQGFTPLAEEKGLAFEVQLEEDLPAEFPSDYKRIEQVLRNLASNALKFTSEGSVTVRFGLAPPAADLSRSGLAPAQTMAISVTDTGIGIAPDEQKKVFEAFQQADGSISRKYGGTGLGLSISREIIRLLHGEIQLASAPGEGSTFTVFLPLQLATAPEVAPAAVAAAAAIVQPAATPPAVSIADDRAGLVPGNKTILIVEDDPRFASLLLDQCRERGFLGIVCASGEEALVLAGKYQPKAIVLDIKLPGIDGWQVLEQLKAASSTRHIPIHVISGTDLSGDALRRGAIGQLRKPVSQADVDAVLRQLEDAASDRVRRVLLVEDNAPTREDIVELLADETVEVVQAPNGAAAIAELHSGAFDCMILDLSLGDMTGGELLEQLAAMPEISVPPVIVYTARDLTAAEEQELRQHSETIILKGVRSQERLLDEVSLFLHQVVSDMPERKRQVILDLHDSDAALRGKHVLVVDDDMRTVFAVSKLLADHGMEPHKAENGERALALLAEVPHIDIVLTDIMMPVMDGLETIKRIRSQPRFSRLPVIALTAKAMKGDQERCLAAGASDYMPKPVDPDRLLSLLRVWLHR